MMNVTRFAGKADGNPKDIQRTKPDRYLEFTKQVKTHQGEIDAMNCDLHFKKKYPVVNVTGDEYFRLTAKPEGDAEQLRKLQERGFKYANGVKYKYPTIGKQGVISVYVKDAIDFAKQFGDALKKPSPHVSPFLIHKSGVEDYEKAKKAFADVLEGDEPKIKLAPDIRVKLTRKKELHITIPQATGKPFVQTLKFDPDKVRDQNQHSEDADAKAGNWLAVFIKNGLEYVQEVAQDLPRPEVQQPVDEPQVDEHDKHQDERLDQKDHL